MTFLYFKYVWMPNHDVIVLVFVNYSMNHKCWMMMTSPIGKGYIIHI